MTKRIFSLLTALALCLTLVPTAVFAETVEAPEPVPVCVCQTRCGEAQINEACPACGGTAAQPERCAAPRQTQTIRTRTLPQRAT